MSKLVLVRHGQSEWNKRNFFTGWVDVPLSRKGVDEALAAGKKMSHIHFDVIFTSTLIRAQMTAMLAMAEHATDEVPVFHHQEEGDKQTWYDMHSDETRETCIPVYKAWQLNERMYGELQGLDKDKTREKFGKEKVKIWRRSFDSPPPKGESLEMTAERTIPFFKETIIPYLEKGENVLISAHGNSLRSIVMELDKLTPGQVLELEIPTGKPLFYEYKDGDWTRHNHE
jgi:2,3-bisphosphoglycerate-dependent phosphoglycerate mutase